MIRRYALDRMDHWFDPAFDLAEDMDFFLRLLLADSTFGWLKEVLSDYRLIHQNDPSIYLNIYHSRRQVLQKILSRILICRMKYQSSKKRCC
jgi:hypothetical protein